MDYFFVYSIQDPNRHYLVNPIRIVQALLCFGSLGLAIFLIVEEPLIYLGIKVMLGLTAAAFATVTLIDVISNTHLHPIPWLIWIMFATSGALFYFVCTGLLFATATGVAPNLVIGEVVYGVTGIMFLIDILYILRAMKKRYTAVTPARTERTVSAEKGVKKGIIEDKKVTKSETRITETQYPGRVTEEERVETTHEHYEGPAYAPPYVPQYQQPPHTPPMRSASYISPPSTPPPLPRETPPREGLPSKGTKPLCFCSTSYGGTFYMGKDATPLPSPEPLTKSKTVACRCPQPIRPKRVISSSSQIIEKKVTETSRIYPGRDGRMQLADGTPLIPMQTEKGELWYKSPEGVAYNSDGIPIVSPAPSKRSVRQPMQTHKVSDDKLMLSDGTIVKPITNKSGEVIYKSADNVLYASDGTPLASTPELSARLESEHLGQELSKQQQQTARDRSIEQMYRSGSLIHETSPLSSPRRSERVESVTQTPRQGSQRGIQTIVTKEKSVESVSQIPKQMSQKSVGKNASTRIIEHTIEEKVVETSEPPTAPEYYTLSSPSRDYDMERTLGGTASRQQASSRSVLREKQALGDSYKIIEHTVRQRSVEKIDGVEKSFRESIQENYHPFEAEKTVTGASRQSITRSDQYELRSPRSNSRTVAVSTRMIPKAAASREKCHSAPGTAEQQREMYYRPVKSAEAAPRSSRSQGENYHPLYCAKSVVICSAAAPCGNPNCAWCGEGTDPHQEPSKLTCSHHTDSIEICVPPKALQTISECECETDPSSTWEQERMYYTSASSSLPPSTSINNVQTMENASTNCNQCGYCVDPSCSLHRNIPRDTQDVQTSETRIVRAKELQKLNTK